MASQMLYYANSEKGRVQVVARSRDVGHIEYLIEYYEPHAHEPRVLDVAHTIPDARATMMEFVRTYL